MLLIYDVTLRNFTYIPYSPWRFEWYLTNEWKIYEKMYRKAKEYLGRRLIV